MITISTDKSKLQIAVIHNFITKTYWAKDRTIAEVKNTIEHSLCFGVYLKEKQIGFARIVTDYTVFTYLMDVFILPKHRGNGYSKQLMRTIINAKELENCTTWMLKTKDAHGLYTSVKFDKLKHPEKIMERIVIKK